MNAAELSRENRAGILRFLDASKQYLVGRVLDFGSGKQPYRELVSTVAEYCPYDRAAYPNSVAPEDVGPDNPFANEWDTILCTQVNEYVPDFEAVVRGFYSALRPGGHLVMTYVTNWPEFNSGDIHRHTQRGMDNILVAAGFEILSEAEVSRVQCEDFALVTGYGVVAKRPK